MVLYTTKLTISVQNHCLQNKIDLPALSVTMFYKCLGVDLGASGNRVTCIRRLEEKIMAIRRAPLKPQQRLWILKTHLIPGLFHQLTLRSVTKDVLSGRDRIVSRTMRNILNWPSDTPVEMFYAEEIAGGLGIPLLKVCIPRNVKSNDWLDWQAQRM